MASDAFTQGGVGEVPIGVVLRANDKAFFTLEEKKLAADLWESKNPGVTVRRDWETAAEHGARVKAREAVELPVSPALGMDPERARPELAREYRFMEGLSVEHPDYEKLFVAHVTQIHALEDICSLVHTEYSIGTAPKKARETADPELTAKLAKYYTRNIDIRRKSIEATKDLAFLALIRDTENTPELQELAMKRIMAVRSAA